METEEKAAIVTGASSGIGLAVSRELLDLGFCVFGIGRDFSGRKLPDSQKFYPIVCDLLDTDRLCMKIKEIAKENLIYILVNNAGVGYYGLHEELNPKKIQQMVRTNLEVPMILTQQLLRQIKKNRGYIINISSVTAVETNPHGCAYGATKAGLLSFSRSLFEEARRYGVKVVSVLPDMTKTNLYRNADFEQAEETQAYLLPKDAAEAVSFVLSRREDVVISEIMLKPQLRRIKRKKQ